MTNFNLPFSTSGERRLIPNSPSTAPQPAHYTCGGDYIEWQKHQQHLRHSTAGGQAMQNTYHEAPQPLKVVASVSHPSGIGFMTQEITVHPRSGVTFVPPSDDKLPPGTNQICWTLNTSERIEQVGKQIIELLQSKNRAYGDSAFKSPSLCPDMPAGAAILVRMSDKIQRLQTLLAKPEISAGDESIKDTMRDLAGYAILYLICDMKS